jgi:putative nucleotidyltransferase with HDIG domain
MSSAGDVSKVMERDQSLTAKVLKLVNSAYYGIPGGISSLQRAISYLGYDTVNQLVIAATVFSTLNKPKLSEFNLGEFWKHAVGVAMTAETIAKWAKFPNPQDCFTCGLLHDIGKVALYLVAHDYLDGLVEAAKKDGKTFHQTELARNVIPHNIVGAMLARVWKLPQLIESSILLHHEPDPKKRNIVKSDVMQVVDIVYFANSIVHEIDFGDSGHNQKIPVDENFLKRLQLNSVQMPLILKDVNRHLATAEDFIKIIAGDK